MLNIENHGTPVYRMARLNAGSAKYGPCECCGRDVDTTYYLVEGFTYSYRGRFEGVTHNDARNLFGHRECLQNATNRAAP